MLLTKEMAVLADFAAFMKSRGPFVLAALQLRLPHIYK